MSTTETGGVNALIEDAKTRAERYQDLIRQEVHFYMKQTNFKRIGDNLKIAGMRLLSDRRTYFVAGGILISYVIIRLVSGRRKSRKITTSAGAVTVRSSRPSLLSTLAVEAMKLFLLHYMKKLLTQYLEQRPKP